MKAGLKGLAKDFLPPALLRGARTVLSRHGWRGDYPDWASARAASRGYDSEVVLERVTGAVRAVLDGRAAYERDAVAFREAEYRWPLLASIGWAAAGSEGPLTVMDVGGSLGTTYLQHRAFLERGAAVHWRIVEQPGFVHRGRDLFGEGPPEFFETVEECVAVGAPDLVLFASSLQYFREPGRTLASATASRPPHLILDRTPFIESGRNRLTVQSVPPRVYPASYPCWLFDRGALLDSVSDTYRVVAELPCEDRGNLGEVTFRGFFFARVNAASRPC